MKPASVIVVAAALTAAVADDDKECHSREFFPTKEVLTGLNKILKNIHHTHYRDNFTDQSSGKNFEMRFSGFAGVIKPLPAQDQKSSGICELRESKGDQLDSADYASKNVSSYAFHEEGVDWWTANRTCVDEGAHLVVINSDEEAQLLTEIFAMHANLNNDFNNKMFIGASDLEEEGVFVTVLGNELSQAGYAKWRAGNPDDWKAVNPLGEDCVEMGRDSLLNDIRPPSYGTGKCLVKCGSESTSAPINTRRVVN